MIKYILKNKLVLTFFLLSIPMSVLFSIKFALSFQPIIDAAANKNSSLLISSALWCGAYAILNCAFLLIIKILKENILRNCSILLKSDLFNNIINRNMENFNSENSSNYISLLNNDVKIIINDYFENILELYNIVISFIFSIITVCLVNYIVTIILIVIAICSVLIPKCFENSLAKLQDNYSTSMKRYLSQIKDFFEGFQLIKSFNLQQKVITSHKKYNLNAENLRCKTNKKIYFTGWIPMFFSSIMYVITFILGGYLIIIGSISIGYVVSLSQLIGGVVAPIEQLPSILASINSTSKVKTKLQKILTVHKINNNSEITNLNISDISFENVSFSYKNSNTKALNDNNINFEANKNYAIVGESGSGKSTIAKLILQFYKCNEGTVNYNNYSTISLESLYHSISYIHQYTFLFDDTLKNNITLYKNYTDTEIENAIKLSGLSKLIEKLPDGIESKIGENGSILSGGERQRISIARALISRSHFLILDEAVSSLDNITAKNIMDNIFELNNITLIIITHRLDFNVLNKCDYIYVMKDGYVSEKGTFNSLINKHDYFFNLYNLNA